MRSFFSRALAVPEGAPQAEVVAQVGLALEALSPFPLSQLYYGYYQPAGAGRVLAFASYKRRFTADQLAGWAGADHVMPAFAAVLGAEVGPATTVLLTAPDGLTAVHWDQGPVPASVLHVPLAADATDEARARARAGLIASAGETRTVVDVPSPPIPQPGRSDSEVAFQAGSLRSTLSAAVMDALDIRDRADLEALHRARTRDVLLWRVAVGSLAACLLFALGEAALFGGGLLQAARVARMAAQKPTVDRIMDEQELANRIDDLSTKRLLPLEMISSVSPETALPKVPTAIQFLRAQTSGLDTIMVEAQTTNAGEIAGYKAALEQNPACQKVEIRDQRARDNVVSFTLVVTFRQAALAPATS